MSKTNMYCRYGAAILALISSAVCADAESLSVKDKYIVVLKEQTSGSPMVAASGMDKRASVKAVAEGLLSEARNRQAYIDKSAGCGGRDFLR